MHPKMERQNKGTSNVAKNFVENIQMDEYAGLTIAVTRQKWLDNHLDQLEAERKRLNDELKQIVLTYSAKIQLINELLSHASRECGGQDCLIEICEERGMKVDGKTATDASG
ncbi:hypothetical protein P9B03_08445 [Metasolibacillus meyeri]|uniref:Uncharacterized protein n=1 Tax=Metasolibacillus meyeri TaxID=1071052 RepID=A0AAW9NM80_9BACL|nr:hypothetical protein [Metasolibacillus meyeri]MEC1178507.1 hypothetical protein [Metasolibacillus meyeri]